MAGEGEEGPEGEEGEEVINLDFSKEFRPIFDALMAAVPTLKITSGRRTLTSQLEAMLINEAKAPGYIEKTYIPTPIIRWIIKQLHTRNLAKMTLARRALGWTFDIEDQFSKADQQRLSRHIIGDAVDFQPGTPQEEAAILKVLASQAPTKFLTHENNLPRWHIQLL